MDIAHNYNAWNKEFDFSGWQRENYNIISDWQTKHVWKFRCIRCSTCGYETKNEERMIKHIADNHFNIQPHVYQEWLSAYKSKVR